MISALKCASGDARVRLACVSDSLVDYVKI